MDELVFVTGLHGDENIPIFALASKNIPQVIGNPEALCLGKRFLDQDLNKSFGTSGNSYEERRAKEILELIPENKTVVDFHTTSAITDPFVIVVDPALIPFAKTLGLKHVVYMKMSIKAGHALINYRSGVSVEAGNHNSFETFDNVIKIMKELKLHKEPDCLVYEVYAKIEEEGSYQNFVKHPSGFYPVLAGEKAYDFPGLKAKPIL